VSNRFTGRANTANLLSLEKASIVDNNEMGLVSDGQLAIRWEVPFALCEECKDYLIASKRSYSDFDIGKKHFAGTYRIVRVDVDDSRGSREPAVVTQIIAKGFTTTLLSGGSLVWTTARLIDNKELDGDSYGSLRTYETDNNSDQEFLTVRFPYIDPKKVETVKDEVQGLAYNTFAPTIKTESYGSGWTRLWVNSRIEEDGSASVFLFLGNPRFNVEGFFKYDTSEAEDTIYLYDIPQQIVQSVINSYKSEGNSVRVQRDKSSGLFSLVISTNPADPRDFIWHISEQDYLGVTARFYYWAVTPAQMPYIDVVSPTADAVVSGGQKTVDPDIQEQWKTFSAGAGGFVNPDYGEDFPEGYRYRIVFLRNRGDGTYDVTLDIQRTVNRKFPTGTTDGAVSASESFFRRTISKDGETREKIHLNVTDDDEADVTADIVAAPTRDNDSTGVNTAKGTLMVIDRNIKPDGSRNVTLRKQLSYIQGYADSSGTEETYDVTWRNEYGDCIIRSVKNASLTDLNADIQRLGFAANNSYDDDRDYNVGVNFSWNGDGTINYRLSKIAGRNQGQGDDGTAWPLYNESKTGYRYKYFQDPTDKTKYKCYRQAISVNYGYIKNLGSIPSGHTITHSNTPVVVAGVAYWAYKSVSSGTYTRYADGDLDLVND